MQNISEASQQNSQAVGQIEEQSKNLSILGESLQSMVNEYTL